MYLKPIISRLFLLWICGYADAQQHVVLDRSPKIISVPARGYVVLQEKNILPNTAYLVCQAHVQTGKITLSLKHEVEHSTSVSGKDVGVVSLVLTSNTTDMFWYLYSNSSQELRALVHVKHYTGVEPLPGGCNEEFQLENDPNIHLNVHDTKTSVQFQRSNVGYVTSGGVLAICDDKVYQAHLEYHVYVRYIQGGDFSEGTYLKTLQTLLTAADTTTHATWLKTMTQSSVTELDIASYNKQGVVYTVVVKDKHQGTEAAYIPVVTYACDIDSETSCKHRDVLAVVLSSLGAIVGLFLCFFGHRFFKTENFLFGFMMFTLVFYQIIALETSISDVGTLALGAVLGLTGGALLLALWWYKGIPVLSVLLISLLLGYLLASIVFYTPFGNLSYWSTSYNYGAVFACAVLIGPVILLLFTRLLNILSCAVIGSYLVIIAMDTYLLSGMRYIVLNSLRHGTDRSYVKVVVSGPFTGNEIGLMIVWLLLCISAVAFQLYRERHKAPFPPCPRQLYDRSTDLRRLLKPSHSPPPRGERPASDREPLMRGNIRQYGAVTQQGAINGDSHDTDEEEETDEDTAPDKRV